MVRKKPSDSILCQYNLYPSPNIKYYIQDAEIVGKLYKININIFLFGKPERPCRQYEGNTTLGFKKCISYKGLDMFQLN